MSALHAQLRLAEQALTALEGQRTAWWQTGKFSLQSLAHAQELIAALPNPRTEALATLAKFKAGKSSITHDRLALMAIGVNDQPLSAFDEDARLGLTGHAIAALEKRSDADLLVSAKLLADSLPNYRDRYTQRLAPIAAWAERHREEIEEEASV